MLFGKKKIEAYELGRSIYEGLIRMPFLDSQNELSYKIIVHETLKISPSEPLPKFHIVEVIAGVLFGAQLALTEKFNFNATMKKINDGIVVEMLVHFKELGFKESESGKLVSQCFRRIDEYFQIFTGGESSDVTLTIGKRFYWNVMGREEGGIKLLEIAPMAFLKMVFAQQCVRKFLNDFKII